MNNFKVCQDTTTGLIGRFRHTFHGLTQAESALVLDQVAAIVSGQPKPTNRLMMMPWSQSVYLAVDSTTRTFRASVVPGPKTWQLVVDTGTDDMLGKPYVLSINVPAAMAQHILEVLQQTYEEAILKATNKPLKENPSSIPRPDQQTSDWEAQEFQHRTGADAVPDIPGLPAALQLSSRIPVAKDKAKGITTKEKGKKKMDERGSTAGQGPADAPNGQWELESSTTIHKKQEARGHPKIASATEAGFATKDGEFKTAKLPLAAQRSMPESISSVGRNTNSSADIFREGPHSLATANPMMVSTMGLNPPQATQQSTEQKGQWGTKYQSMLAKPAENSSSITDAQASPTQPKQQRTASGSSGVQLKPGCTGFSGTSARAPPGLQGTSARAPPGLQAPKSTAAPPPQTPAPPPMWCFTGRSGGPATPNAPPQTQFGHPTPPATVPATSDEAAEATHDEFLQNYITHRYSTMEGLADYMDRSLFHSCRRRDCIQAPGIQADGTFRFYRPPPALTFYRPYGPGLAEGPTPSRRRPDGRRNYYD